LWLAFPRFASDYRDLTQQIIHTLVKATVFENVCHFRSPVSAIATHFLQTVFSTVHYMILLCQIPSAFSATESAEMQAKTGAILPDSSRLTKFYQIIVQFCKEKH